MAKKQKGRLANGLVSPDVMAGATKQLLESSANYVIVLKRWPFNWTLGSKQTPYYVLYQGDPVQLDGTLDERLVKARDVLIVAFTHDRGIARVSITRRSWEI